MHIDPTQIRVDNFERFSSSFTRYGLCRLKKWRGQNGKKDILSELFHLSNCYRIIYYSRVTNSIPQSFVTLSHCLSTDKKGTKVQIPDKSVNPVHAGGGGGAESAPLRFFLHNSKTPGDIRKKLSNFNFIPLTVILHILSITIVVRCCHSNLLFPACHVIFGVEKAKKLELFSR